MKKIILILFLVHSGFKGLCQNNKLTILDFENLSNNSEYDALGRSMSNMLISDIKNNVTSKIEFIDPSFVKRKIIEDSKNKSNKNFDVNAAIEIGRLCEIKWIVIGKIFAKDDDCKISLKLIDVENSNILLSQNQDGKLVDFLKLKSQLAESLVLYLNNINIDKNK